MKAHANGYNVYESAFKSLRRMFRLKRKVVGLVMVVCEMTLKRKHCLKGKIRGFNETSDEKLRRF